MDIEKNIRDNLDGIIHMSLATAKNNKPWVSEVHFAYDGNLNLYFRSLISRRHSSEIAENPNVAGNIVRQHGLKDHVVGVYFEGRAKLLGPGDEQQRAFECLSHRLGLGDSLMEEAKKSSGHQFYKISVDNFYLFGAFNGNQNQKYTLEWGRNG